MSSLMGPGPFRILVNPFLVWVYGNWFLARKEMQFSSRLRTQSLSCTSMRLSVSSISTTFSISHWLWAVVHSEDQACALRNSSASAGFTRVACHAKPASRKKAERCYAMLLTLILCSRSYVSREGSSARFSLVGALFTYIAVSIWRAMLLEA